MLSHRATSCTWGAELKNLKRDNHYVPHSYLKRWADSNEKVWSYRLLVPHHRASIWKPHSPKSLGYHEHLYTRVIASGESDAIERWLDSDFESPAGKPLQKAVSDLPLARADWTCLVRLLAAQDVRTPARLSERLTDWHLTMEDVVSETLTDSVQELEAAKRAGTALTRSTLHEENPHFPLRTSIQRSPQNGGGLLRVDVTIGRGLWLWNLTHLLTKTLNVLLQHRWTILKSPPGFEWLTSDVPVLRLNYRDEKNYDFKGGWGSVGTEIFMPLSPHHLIYTRIGRKPPARGTVLSEGAAACVQRFIVENAHRYVYGRSANPSVLNWRPRTVDSGAFHAEAQQWSDWNSEQSRAERALLE
jgi:hypothetical protein